MTTTIYSSPNELVQSHPEFKEFIDELFVDSFGDHVIAISAEVVGEAKLLRFEVSQLPIQATMENVGSKHKADYYIFPLLPSEENKAAAALLFSFGAQQQAKALAVKTQAAIVAIFTRAAKTAIEAEKNGTHLEAKLSRIKALSEEASEIIIGMRTDVVRVAEFIEQLEAEKVVLQAAVAAAQAAQAQAEAAAQKAASAAEAAAQNKTSEKEDKVKNDENTSWGWGKKLLLAGGVAAVAAGVWWATRDKKAAVEAATTVTEAAAEAAPVATEAATVV